MGNEPSRLGAVTDSGIGDLSALSIDDAPACCAGCSWWQTRSSGRAPERRRWMSDVEDDFGTWGKIYRDDQRVVALLQYAPAEMFPRAARLPAGPPSYDAILATCAFVVPPTGSWALQSLLLAAIGELRDRHFPALEAFAYRSDPQERRPHAIFPREILSELGFQSLRVSGQVELMRLDLRSIVTVEAEHPLLARAWSAIRARGRVAVPTG